MFEKRFIGNFLVNLSRKFTTKSKSLGQCNPQMGTLRGERKIRPIYVYEKQVLIISIIVKKIISIHQVMNLLLFETEK